MPDPAIISSQKRRKALALVFSTLAVVGAAVAAYWWFIASRRVETDNAYVSGDMIPVSAQVAGQVTQLFVDENRVMTAGALALKLDDADARIALRQAESKLERERRAVAVLFSNTKQSTTDIAIAQARIQAAELALASSRITFQSADSVYRRRLALQGSDGAVSEEELTDARDKQQRMQLDMDLAQATLSEARLALEQAKERASSAHLQTDGLQVSTHPSLQLAAQSYEEAHLNLDRTRVTIPVEGWVAKRYVQLGQRVVPNQPLLSVVPPSSMFIEANFKETETRDLAPGQCAEIVSDRFGSRVTYRAAVESIGVGTGSVFSRVPVQNAAGNWVKIVQRVPVRLRLDHQQLKQYPLSLGMSTVATVKLDADCRSMLQTQQTLRELPSGQTDVAESAATALTAVTPHSVRRTAHPSAR